jgi:hydantoinase/carbamoylase family amidase
MNINQESLIADLDRLAQIGRGADGGITRRALSFEDAEARGYVKQRLAQLGLEIRHDEVGNLRGRRPGRRDLPPVMTGSHLDSVPSGGRLDGPLGVVGAIAALEALGSVQTVRPIEVVVFVGEEGSRFPRGTIGSAAMSGHVAVQKIWELRDPSGVSFRDALATYGDEGEPIAARSAPFAFVELHVEQGGVLEADRLPIGAVTAIAGLVQRAVTFFGDANHAGATPMHLRHDALLAAAEWCLGIEAAARELGCVGTVGKLEVQPGGKNIIPGRVDCICDLRAAEASTLDALDRRALQLLEQVQKRGVTVEERLLQRVEPGPMHERAIAGVERAAAAAGLGCRRMPSGAIHDALHMAEICPASMIFVPSIGGRSHCPTEDTEPRHLVLGSTVLARFLLEFANLADEN